MRTQYLGNEEKDILKAAELLHQGCTVIFPTETVYGLGANAYDAAAVEKIFAAKGRPSDNPLIVHIAKRDMLTEIVAEMPECACKLMDTFWPGPLTLIFKKSSKIPGIVTGGMDTVAVRMPEHPLARKLLELVKLPIAAPSANRSGLPSPTMFSHVKDDMDGRVDAIMDGGDCQVGVESTVLDVSGEIPILYRPGGITKEEIEVCIGKIQVVTHVKDKEAPKSPGLKYKHYAPHAEVRILKGDMNQVAAYTTAYCEIHRVGMLVFDEFPVIDSRLIRFSLGHRDDAVCAAQRLFRGLRHLDEERVDIIFAPEIPDNGVWSAVRNRLYRAGGNQIWDLTKDVKKVLFVCTGNTCRSPMAEGLCNQMADSRKLPWIASSAGLFASGALASSKAMQAMQEQDIDITNHVSRQITLDMLEQADLVLTMTESHRTMLLQLFPQYADKIETIGGFSEKKEDIIDPYGGSVDDYRACKNQIKALLEAGWGKLV